MAQCWGGVHQFVSHIPLQSCLASGLRYESRTPLLLASDSSDGSFAQGPAEETSARGSLECPCRAFHPLNFPRDGHEPCADSTGSNEFPSKRSVTARCGIDETIGPWLRPRVEDTLLLAQQTVHMNPDCLLIAGGTTNQIWFATTSTFSLHLHPPLLRKWCSLPCVLCGHGDNSVQRWLFFCPIPACAGSLLLRKVWKTQYWFFSLSSSLSQRAIISGLWVGRYTLLRWAVNQDDDVWLSMRGTRHPQEQIIAWAQEWEIKPAHDVVCRACGCGDNTIGHWTRWCVVPLIVAIAVLKPGARHFTLCQLACQSPRNAAVCALILACFRRLLRQEGAFLHQQSAEAKLVQWWILKLHENVARDAHVQLQVDFPICHGALERCSLNGAQVGVQRILPLDYSTMHLPPLIGVSQADVPANSQLAVLPLNSPVVAALREMEVTATSMQSNVRVSLIT